MVYNWSELGINQITNLFLYGNVTKPTNLIDDSLIRPATSDITITLDAVSFMADGPGRFAEAPISPLISGFFLVDKPEFSATGARREYTKAEVSQLFGYTKTEQNNIVFQAFNYEDSLNGANDYLLRSYIYNSESFRAFQTMFYLLWKQMAEDI